LGPGGNFLSEESTAQGVRGGEWCVSQLVVHDTFEGWVAAERPRLLEEACQKVEQILATQQPLPLPRRSSANLTASRSVLEESLERCRGRDRVRR